MYITNNATLESQQHAVLLHRDRPQLRLDFLDGIRALAALYVALFHAAGYAGYNTTLHAGLSAPMRFIASILDYGTDGVPIFIVLSGFCLMLPLAQSKTTYIPGGVSSYIRRRAWRILPSYYAALFLFLGLIALLPVLQISHNTSWDIEIPVTTGGIVSHLLLIHDLNRDWIYKIDGPMWSIAVEWQIYFLFPALLLPVLRRSNILATIGFGLVVGVLPHFLLPHSMNLDVAHPWFLGLFAMGMAGAIIVFSNNATIAMYRRKIRGAWLGITVTLGLVCALALIKDWMGWHPYIAETWVGIAVMCWLIRYGSDIRDGERHSLFHRLLESRVLVTLGTFSYSIYLIHNPIQGLINLELLNLNLSADARLAIAVGLATPFAVVCSYAFYVFVERKSLRVKQRIASAQISSAHS